MKRFIFILVGMLVASQGAMSKDDRPDYRIQYIDYFLGQGNTVKVGHAIDERRKIYKDEKELVTIAKALYEVCPDFVHRTAARGAVVGIGLAGAISIYVATKGYYLPISLFSGAAITFALTGVIYKENKYPTFNWGIFKKAF